jgi:hypothetical protein
VNVARCAVAGVAIMHRTIDLGLVIHGAIRLWINDNY